MKAGREDEQNLYDIKYKSNEKELLNSIIFEGKDYYGTPIITLYACLFSEGMNYDTLFKHVVNIIIGYGDKDFLLLYFHYGLSNVNRPTLKTIVDFYKSLSRKIGKRMKKLFVVHPTGFIKVLITLFKPVMNSKLIKKLFIVETIPELCVHFNEKTIPIPKEVIAYDKIQCEKNRKLLKPFFLSIFNRPDPLDEHSNLWFGVSLTTLNEQKLVTHGIPNIVSKYSDYIVKYGLKEEGIFRKSPSHKELLEYIDNIKIDCSETISSVSIASSVIKKFYISLPEPIFTFNAFTIVKEFEENDKSDSEKIELIKQMTLELPPINVVNIQFIAKLFDQVFEHFEDNKMNYGNLAVVFGPSLLWSNSDEFTIEEFRLVTEFLSFFFENHSKIIEKCI